MVKSGVRAMDAIQQFVKIIPHGIPYHRQLNRPGFTGGYLV
jgi:hypothetical protein